ncbi:MAG: hypothetical protein J07HQW1_02921 [Haloquadratum walsbyi J07HQW1]|uniref:Uncharacterized protein n=1 Tax=Haloquadratum walsbyi J07HQW1 TaxID=1238424 RepID=U1PGY6_9EURY|nr:MAG: hypothetical protein J07HQW1_02921 [Haloquadratum walsbyi J07HQW1]
MMPVVSVSGDINIIYVMFYTQAVPFMKCSKNTKSNQRIAYYFGTSGSSKPTMEEVDSFITEEMGLVRDDGGAKWTEGVTELIMLGMDSWRQGQVERAHLVSPERVESLEERNRELREKVSDLQAKVDKLDRGQEDRSRRPGTAH